MRSARPSPSLIAKQPRPACPLRRVHAHAHQVAHAHIPQRSDAHTTAPPVRRPVGPSSARRARAKLG
eukprot:1829801-Prymnesium_polylepis.1